MLVCRQVFWRSLCFSSAISIFTRKSCINACCLYHRVTLADCEWLTFKKIQLEIQLFFKFKYLLSDLSFILLYQNFKQPNGYFLISFMALTRCEKKLKRLKKMSRPIRVLVSVSSRAEIQTSRRNVGRSWSRSRLELKTKCLGLISVSDLKISFTTLVHTLD